MKLLHTSDWHLGRTLYGRKRYAEFEAFLDWLAETIAQHDIDALLVAGDIFDTTTPSNRSQEMYYRFLCRVAVTSCRHVVIIGGNHDSPSFLDAPRELLRALNVHVIGCICGTLEDEVQLLCSAENELELIVCAVPFLRDRDIRVATAGESIEDKDRNRTNGILEHYVAVCALAEQKRAALGSDIPIVAMGHLFTAGAKVVEGDGVRDLYVGSLPQVTAGMFSSCLSYVALGHLHVPQIVGDGETIRYSGAPLPMGFGEASQQKGVCLVEIRHGSVTVQQIEVPTFQPLERIRGDWDAISRRLSELSTLCSRAWIEILYDGVDIMGDLRERIDAAVTGTSMEILRVQNNRVIDRALKPGHAQETLDDLDVYEVFDRCLTSHEVTSAQKHELNRTYREAVLSLDEEDHSAE